MISLSKGFNLLKIIITIAAMVSPLFNRVFV